MSASGPHAGFESLPRYMSWDELVVGEEEYAQVKCWESEMTVYKVGDTVPTLNDKRNYAIMLREGGAALIANGVFGQVITSDRAEELAFIYDLPIFDKWGRVWSRENRSPIAKALEEEFGESLEGDTYFFAEQDLPER